MKRMFFALTVICTLAFAPAYAQQAASPGYKDPGTATLLGVLVPGGGQMYSGETGKGLALLGVGMGGLVLGVAATTSSVGVSCDDDFTCEDDTNYLPMAAGYLAYFGAWLYGVLDADDSANRMNTKRGLAGNVAPVIAPSAGGRTEVGLSVRF